MFRLTCILQPEPPRSLLLRLVPFPVHHALIPTLLLPRGQVLVEALPPKWDGKLLFAEHMAGFVSTNHRLGTLGANRRRGALLEVQFTRMKPKVLLRYTDVD